MPRVVEAVRKGARFTVLYRSRVAFEIVPPGWVEKPALPLSRDPLYRARAVGSSRDGSSGRNHDADLYPRRGPIP